MLPRWIPPFHRGRIARRTNSASFRFKYHGAPFNYSSLIVCDESFDRNFEAGCRLPRQYLQCRHRSPLSTPLDHFRVIVGLPTTFNTCCCWSWESSPWRLSSRLGPWGRRLCLRCWFSRSCSQLLVNSSCPFCPLLGGFCSSMLASKFLPPFPSLNESAMAHNIAIYWNV